jgi:polyhydroxyalkanoate synthesis regulator protein
MAGVPGFEAMQRQQEAFMKAMMGAFVPPAAAAKPTPDSPAAPGGPADELAQIKAQLAELQSRLARF